MLRSPKVWLVALLCSGAIGEGVAAEMSPNAARSPGLHAQLEAAYAAKGSDYTPRTHLKDGDKARYVNRLIRSASPYLLQHAHNPVDWWPWGEEALAEAKARGLPIFLSVGYATCHWCHVMEEESFDNEDIAAILNQHFIAIKIDREEMPALDHIYITATQIQQGQAGWPNSVFLMPDGEPFHTGTYIPPDVFAETLGLIAEAWADPAQRTQMASLAGELSEAVRRVTQLGSAQSAALGEEVYTRAAGQLLDLHNALEGGFSDSQQFPQEGYLLYLLDHWRRTGDEASLAVATETLYAIAAGGIHDHAGGGFHRYTVDPNWRTPHFEKMLYNQGLLARVFIEAWEITGEPIFARAAERTFAYVARDMTDPEGAVYAAEDADSLNAAGEREEGAFYAFTPEGMATAAGPEAVEVLGISEPPTVEAGAVIHFPLGESPDFAVVDPMLEAARLARETRPRPFRDEKIIAGWNALMIRALADGAVAFQSPAYRDQATRAAKALWARLWNGQRLARLWAGGQAHEQGALSDYAWTGLAFLSLADATGDVVWVQRAQLLADAMWETFGDGAGRLQIAAAEGPLGPIYNSSDGALPSGESSALELLARLARRPAVLVDASASETEDGSARANAPADEALANPLRHFERAETLRASLSAQMAEQPLLRTEALMATRLLDTGPRGLRRTAAKGVVHVSIKPDRMRIAIAPGWHLNAHDPGADWLIGTSLEGARLDWPEGEDLDVGFADQRIRVYGGRLDLPVSEAAAEISLRLQACSDSICLEPETLTFRLP